MHKINLDYIRTVTPKLKAEKVKVEEWGGEVIVREMTGADRLDFSMLFGKKSPPVSTVMAFAVSRCVFDTDSAPIFTDPQQVVELVQEDTLTRLSSIAFKLSGITKEESAPGEA